MKSEKEFLIARDNFLNTKLGNYRNKIETLEGVIEVKEELLEVIDRVLPKNYTDKIVNKAYREDETRKQMMVLEHQQSLLRKQVKDILKDNHRERKPSLNIEHRKGIVSIGD
jgi:hypothetical protein